MDPAYIEPVFGDYSFLAMQCLAIVTGGYHVYTSMTSSYYWFNFGRNITIVFTAIANVAMIAFDWQGFVYDRHMMTMLVNRMGGGNTDEGDDN